MKLYTIELFKYVRCRVSDMEVCSTEHFYYLVKTSINNRTVYYANYRSYVVYKGLGRTTKSINLELLDECKTVQV